MKVLIASSSTLAIPLILKFEDFLEHQVLGLLTNQDKPKGRGQKIEANDLASWAENKGFMTYKTSSNGEIVSLLNTINPDIVITIAFGQLIKNAALISPKHGWVNVHFSLLPKWRGAAPVQHSLINGEKSTGVSIFKLDTGLDTGPVYLTKEIKIEDDEDTEKLLNRLSVFGATMIFETLALIEQGKTPIPQLDVGSSLAPKFLKTDGLINWNSTSNAIYNHFRALAGNPGVWTIMGNDRIKVDQLRVTYYLKSLIPGQVIIEDETIIVGSKVGAIEILQLTPAGRNSMSAAEFVRGLLVKDGLSLG